MELNQQQREAIGKNLGSLLESYSQSQPVEQAAPAEGFTWTGYLGDFGSSALGILANLSGAGGTILDWVDGVEPDGTEKNLRTLGRDGFKYIESILEKASEGLADDRPKITQDQVLKGFEDGDFVPAMLFVRDSFPNAAAYLGAAFIGGGIPLLVSESERTLEERMSNLKKGTGEASAVDVGASMLSAIINVWAERIPVLKAGKGLEDKGKMRVSLEALARDLGWEAGGGASEDILTKIGTDAELTAKGVSLAAFFEALGGLGVSPVAMGGQLSRRNAQIKAREQLESVRENIISDLEAERANTTGRFKKIQLTNKIRNVKKHKTLASLLKDYPEYDPTVELGDDPSVLEDQAPEDDAREDPSAQEDAAPTQGRIEPTLPGPQDRPRQTITVPAEQVPDDIDPDNLPEGVSIDEDGKLTITITEGGAETGEGQRDSEGRIVTPTLGGPADIDVPAFGVEGESTLEPEVPEVLPTTEAESTDGLDASLSEEERAIRIRQARERADRAQAAEAETPGKATEEDLKLTEEARKRADEGERSETPIIETELGPSTINTGDIELDNRVEENRDRRRAARESAQNIPQDRDETARQAADPNRKEQLEREKAERDDLQRQAEADERARAAAEEREAKRQERAAKEKAEADQLEAENRAYNFILPYLNVNDDTPVRAIKAASESVAEEIGREIGPEARSIFRKEVQSRIKDLQVDREQDAKDRKEAAAAEREAKAAAEDAPTQEDQAPEQDASEDTADEAGEAEAESTTPPPGPDTTADEGAPAAPKKKKPKKKAKKKTGTRKEPDIGTPGDSAGAAEDADKKKDRKPPTRRQQNRKPGWKTKEDESRSTGSLNGLPATITKVETTSVDKEGKEKVDSHYEASYDGEKVVNEKTKQPVEWAKIDNAQQWLENKFASKKVKEALAKARGKAAWTQDSDTRWSKMIDGSSAVVTKEGDDFKVSYKGFDHPKKSFTSLGGAQRFLDSTYPKKRTRVKAEDVDAPKSRPTRVFDNPDPLPKAPEFTGQIKTEVDEGGNPVVRSYINGEPFKKHTNEAAARKYLKGATPDKIAKVYEQLAKREQLDESNAARKVKAAASAGKKDAKAQARIKREAAKQAPKARQPKMLSPFNFAWSEWVADKKTSAAKKPNVEIKGNYELSKAEDSEGYDISVTYPGRKGEIVLFSVPNIDQAQIIADSIRAESPLFLEFLTEQAKNKKIDLIAVRDETAKEFGARNAALEKEISRLEGKDKTSGEVATLNDLKKQRKALKQEAVRVAMPKSSTESLNEWIDLLEDRGVLEASGMDALDQVQEDRAAEAEDAQGMDAQEEAYEDLKKKVETNEELVETLEETEEESVDERNDLVGQIKEDYIVLRDLVEAEETDVVAEILNNTPAKGGMSLSDLRELAKAIASQEDSFQFKSHKTKKEFAAQILEWATEEAVAEYVPSIKDESDFIITDEDLGWSDIKESRSRNPAKGFDSPIQASNALISQMNNIWGKKATRRMMETGFIKILTLAEVKNLSNKYKGISKETNAFVDETDAKIIFISDNIANNTNDARGLILHEIGVHYGKRIFSGREFDQILDQLYKLNRDGDEVVQEAVNQVVLNYTKDGKYPPVIAPPAVKKSDGKYIRHQVDSVFWEEVLAHVIQFKAADIKPTLWDRITKAFVNFFKKITKPFDTNAEPEVDVNDITSLIQYAVGKVPSEALRDPDNDKLRQRYSSKKKYEFLKDSLVKDKVWHASPFAWTAPVIEKTELGLFAGTFDAADSMAKYYEEIYPDSKASMYEGYIKIKNPLELPDVGRFNNPIDWKKSIDEQDLLFHDGLDGPLGEKIQSIINDWTETSKVLTIYKDEGKIAFSKDIRKAILDAGYDSIKYTNVYDDIFTGSYIVLKDVQFKKADSLGFREDQPAISESRGKRITKELVDNTQWAEKGRSSLLSGFKMIQKYIEPKMTLEGYRLLEKQSMLMKGKKEEAHNFGRIMHDILANVKGKKERDALTKFFETRDASPDSLPNRKIEYAPFESVLRGTKPGPKNQSTMTIREAAIKAKDQIERLGQDAVDVGVLKKEQYEELKGQYLPRVYLKYVQSGQDRLGTGYMPGSMGYTRARKDEESFIEDLVSGRIKDPAYLASRYISMVGSDLATINYLNYIASDPANAGWVLPNQVVEIDGVSGTTVYFKNLSGEIRQRAAILREGGQIDDAKKQEAFANKIDKVIAKYPEIKNADTRKYKRIPKSVRYGGMQGLWVDKIIWDDITQQGAISSQNEVLNSILHLFTRVQKAFKYTHVPMQVPAQARNAISNTVFLNASGVPIWRIPSVLNKSMDNIVNNGKYMKIARKYGIEQTTFASEELGRIDKEFAKATKDISGMQTWSKLKIFMDNANVFGRLYQKTEVLFKIAKIIDLMENQGYGEVEAAMEANEALLDYSNVSPLIRTLRSMPLGSPFITFNAKALTQMIRNVKKHPIATGKYLALPFVMAEVLMSQFDELDEEDVEALKAFLPEYAENNGNVFFLPYKDDNGKWVAFDMSYFLPWGAHFSVAKDLANLEVGEAVKTIGVLGGPVQGLLGGLQNVDPFTGQPVWNENDTPHQQAQDIMMFMASYMIPPMLMPRNRAGDIATGGGPLWKTMYAYDVIEGNIGKDGLTKYGELDAWLSWFGINTIKIGDYEMGNKAYWTEKELTDIMKRAEKVMSDPNLTEEKRQELYDEYNKFATQKYLEIMEWSEKAQALA
tara:strand:+ start:2904 stop:11036 length:8133 start_codon:yes stop_codon:yes gene_type:complete